MTCPSDHAFETSAQVEEMIRLLELGIARMRRELDRSHRLTGTMERFLVGAKR